MTYLPPDAGSPTTIAGEQANPTDITMDEKAVYRLTSNDDHLRFAGTCACVP